MQKIKVTIITFLTVLICLGAFSAAAEKPEAKPSDIAEGFALAAENSRFGMYIEQTEFNVAVYDKKSGEIYYSFPTNREGIEDLSGAGRLAAGSHLIVSYYDSVGQSTESVNSLLGSVRQKTVKYKTIDGGIRIDFDFSRSKEGFKIPITITLCEDGIKAGILFDEIDEYAEAYVTNIELLPYFYSATRKDSGYFLVPDGSGAIIEFNAERMGMEPYYADVYGRDPALSTVKKENDKEAALLPVIGIEKNGKALIATVTKGAGTAAVNAMTAGTDTALNNAYFSFTFRKSDSILLADNTWMPKSIQFLANKASLLDEVEVKYILLDKSGIVEMANGYREYLVKNCGLKKDKIDSNNSFSLYGAFKVKKSFLGIPYVKVDSLTDFSQAEKIIKDLLSCGIEGTNVRYFGVLKGGMDDSVPIKAKIESALGGNKGFSELLTKASQLNSNIYPDIEFIRIAKSRFGWWPFNFAAKDIHRSPLVENVFKRSVFYKDTSANEVNYLDVSKIDKVVKKFLKSASKFELSGISVQSLSSIAYSTFSSGREFDEDGTIEKFTSAMQKIKDNTGKIVASGGYDYSTIIADRMYDVPVTDSGYDMSSYRVPFYQFVFSGYKNFCSEPLNRFSDYTKQRLLCIETATAPSFDFTWESTDGLVGTAYEILYSTKYSVWKETAVKAYLEFNETYANISDRTIADYEILSDTLRKTTFADGSVIYVNYSNKDIEAEGKTVTAESFLLVRGQQNAQ